MMRGKHRREGNEQDRMRSAVEVGETHLQQVVKRRTEEEEGQEEEEETVLRAKRPSGPRTCLGCGRGWETGRRWEGCLVASLFEEVSRRVVRASLGAEVRWVVLRLWWRRRMRRRRTGWGRERS